MTDFPPTNPDHPGPSSGQATQSRKRTRTLSTWLLWLGAGFLILLLGAGMLLTYWFPSDMVRQELETRLSVLLKGTVRIEALSFNLLNGLHVRRAQYLREGHPPLKVEKLQLDYSLWNLLQGTLRINEVAIEGADLVLNLPELAQGAVPEEAVPPPTDQPLIPVLPVTVDVNTLKIINTQVVVIVSPDLRVRLAGLNFTSSGGISPDIANLRGSVDIKGVDLTLQNKKLRFPLMVGFDVSVHLPSEKIEIARLSIQSEPTLRLTLDGIIEHPLSEKDVDITLHNTQIDLAQLLRLGQPFIPPDVKDLLVKGTLAPRITVKGSAPDGLFSGRIHGTLEGRNLETTFPAYGVQVGSTNLNLTVKDVRVQRNIPILGQMDLITSVQGVRYQTYQITQLGLSVAGEFLDAGPFSGVIKVSGETTLPREQLGRSIPLPFEISLSSEGNHKTRTIKVSELNARLGPYGLMHGTATLEPRTPPSTTIDAALEVRLLPRLDNMLPLIPKSLLQGITLKKGVSADSIHLRANGVLNQDYLPEAATMATAVKLSSLKARLPEPTTEGTLENLAFLVTGNYQSQDGTIKGTAGLSLNLAQLAAQQQLSIAHTTVILKSNFRGQVSPTFQPTSLHSQDRIQVVLDGLKFTHPTVTATLPTVKLQSHTKEDLLQQDVTLKEFRLTAPDMFEVGLKGRWHQPSQKFDLDFHVPMLRLDQLLSRLTGPLMEGLQDINPSGLMSMSIQAVGAVPSEEAINTLNLPLRIKGTMSLKSAGGKMAGFGLQNTNGTVSLAYGPNASPQLQFQTDLHLENILLPDHLPLQRLPNTALQVKVAAPTPNEVRLDRLRATTNGLQIGVEGTVVGLQAFLNSTKPLGTRLANLYAQLNTQANMDVGIFQQVLTPLGIQGTGEAGLRVHVRKKELGTLDTAIDVNLNQLSLQQDTSAIENTTGTIKVRKSLAWQPEPAVTLRKKRFQPSDVIAQLKRLSDKEHSFTMKRLQIGPLSLENFSTSLQFDQQALKLQNMSMNLLGGGLGGHIILAAENPVRLSAWFEAAKLDLNQLVDPASRITGDSEVAATIGLTALLQPETGALDLSQAELQLHLTHIGKEALDRLLVFLDPQGSNPTLASARAQLKLANPSNVTIEIARGLLSLTIHFQGRFIPTFHLDRIPLAKMKNIERLTAAIPNWEALSKILTMVGAESYSLTPEGELVLQ
ncbi:MAG: hypothetical protein AB7T38_04155 [Nitrospirales bacterium]